VSRGTKNIAEKKGRFWERGEGFDALRWGGGRSHQTYRKKEFGEGEKGVRINLFPSTHAEEENRSRIMGVLCPTEGVFWEEGREQRPVVALGQERGETKGPLVSAECGGKREIKGGSAGPAAGPEKRGKIANPVAK